ncbi:MAG: hypothetical protein HY738_24225 [Bacteroidia bacterium]|nr:hypothetical protein [Bacteroidia bacterium]
MYHRIFIGILIILFALFTLSTCNPCDNLFRSVEPTTISDIECKFQILDSMYKNIFINNTVYHFDSLAILNTKLESEPFRHYSIEDSIYIVLYNFIYGNENEVGNLLSIYFYLILSKTDTDTMKIEYKWYYHGKCKGEIFETFNVYYNDILSFSFDEQVASGNLLGGDSYFEFNCIKK